MFINRMWYVNYPGNNRASFLWIFHRPILRTQCTVAQTIHTPLLYFIQALTYSYLEIIISLWEWEGDIYCYMRVTLTPLCADKVDQWNNNTFLLSLNTTLPWANPFEDCNFWYRISTILVLCFEVCYVFKQRRALGIEVTPCLSG